MPFLTQTKTNWKFIAIVAVLAVIVGAGIWGYLQTIEVVEGPVVEELPVEKPVINPVAEYFEGAELQYEGEDQKENIVTSLNDILSLSEEELQQRRYKDYEGKENQWDLPTLIYRHFVPAWPGVTLGDDFFHDVKLEEAQKQVEQILIEITEESSVEEPEEEKYIKILFPSGGEQLTTGNQYVISWEAENVERVRIRLTEHKGAPRRYQTERLFALDVPTKDGKNSYVWDIPADLPPSEYVLFIDSDDGSPWVSDFSDGYFMISNSLSVQEKEEMLRQMIKGEFEIAGNEIIFSAPEVYYFDSLYLDKIIKGSFAAPDTREHLFVLQARTHKVTVLVLGFFDEGRNFISSPLELVLFADPDWYLGDFPHIIAGLFAEIETYSCQGVTYVLGIAGGCPNGGWCSVTKSSLFGVENSEVGVLQDVFKTILDMKEYDGGPWPEFYLETEKDKVLIYDWVMVDDNFECIAPECLGEGVFGMGSRNGHKAVLIYFGKLLLDDSVCGFIEKPE